MLYDMLEVLLIIVIGAIVLLTWFLPLPVWLKIVVTIVCMIAILVLTWFIMEGRSSQKDVHHG